MDGLSRGDLGIGASQKVISVKRRKNGLVV
jgi:hypothetical protein